jgi:hypothetical protein
MPTASDLVTDLPADFETFGQAVATSMADLLGGTTGQVLSKASNTDMDFTWVAQDDSNAIQNAIVDAKGDLIGATAADTPARLAVGSNYAFLQADSSTATGLLWNNAAFTSYTPTLTSTGGTITSSSVSGKYLRIGKACIVKIAITITTAGTAAGNVPVVTMPFTSANDGATLDYVAGAVRENNVTGTAGTARILNNSTSCYLAPYNNSGGFIADNYKFQFTLVYEVA